YDSLHDTEDNLWSVLLMTGYLTKADPGEEGNTVSLRIPNAEIAAVFETAVVRLFQEKLDRSRQKELMDAFWSGDADTATRLVSDFLFDTISFHDYHEDYYHAFITGIFVGLGYGVRSNREQGLGRTDITLTDKKNRRALVIEAKRSDSEGQMEKDCDDALDQIAEKRYADGLEGYRQIECYGISFFRKSALVKKL
ncbi:MAG: PD-(D/E)XK nuclease domain-containing protein, partial [Lachnospiraceae bacterium]|nr:PD-(D/E)XK nuclease domain-containing protein [Lachnospiraceae bacterium]